MRGDGGLLALTCLLAVVLIACGQQAVPLSEEEQYAREMYAKHQSAEALDKWIADGGRDLMVVRPPEVAAALEPEAAKVLEAMDGPLREAIVGAWPEMFEPVSIGFNPNLASLEDNARSLDWTYPDGFGACMTQLYNAALLALPEDMWRTEWYVDMAQVSNLSQPEVEWFWRWAVREVYSELMHGACGARALTDRSKAVLQTQIEVYWNR